MRPFHSNLSPRRARSWAGPLALCMSLWAWSAQAQVPATLTYQGQLLDAQKQPASGPLEVRFALHDQATGGDELWSETLSELEPDAQGRVHAELGGQTPLKGVFAQAEPRWLSVQVQGEVLEPRLKLTSVPWAMRAGHARRAEARRQDPRASRGEASAPSDGASVRVSRVRGATRGESPRAWIPTRRGSRCLTERLARTAQAEVVRGLSARVAATPNRRRWVNSR